jgi:hypothetical protein
MGNSLDMVVCVHMPCRFCSLGCDMICTRNYKYVPDRISGVHTFCHTVKTFKSDFLKSSKDSSYFVDNTQIMKK